MDSGLSREYLVLAAQVRLYPALNPRALVQQCYIVGSTGDIASAEGRDNMEQA